MVFDGVGIGCISIDNVAIPTVNKMMSTVICIFSGKDFHFSKVSSGTNQSTRCRMKSMNTTPAIKMIQYNKRTVW